MKLFKKTAQHTYFYNRNVNLVLSISYEFQCVILMYIVNRQWTLHNQRSV